MDRSNQNRDLVARAVDELFVTKDLGAVDRYFAEPYLQHNPLLPSGLEAFRELAQGAIVGNPGFKAARLCALADGELVAVHHRYIGLGPVPFMAVDLFRVQDGKVVEHWDCLQEETPESDRHCAELAKLNNTRRPDNAERHRAAVTSFIETTWMASFSDDDGKRWGPPPHGTERLISSPGTRQDPLHYARVHRILADGNLVLTQSEAATSGQTYVCYDLFLVEGDVVIRYWSLAQGVPSSSVSGLGMF